MALKAALHIETAVRNEKTFLKFSFCTQPFKLADITEGRRSKVLKLMMRSSSPGVLDGDDYEIKISLAEASLLQLITQSYQRIFHMKESAKQIMNVEMKEGSSFIYLPHPSVPHEGSNYLAKNKVYLSDNCTLLWSEIISCGRKLNGEIFCFNSYRTVTEIFKNGQLVVKENLWLKPLQIPLTGIGLMEGFSHQATLIFLDEKVNVAELIKSLNSLINTSTDMAFGITALPANGCLLRVLGNKAEPLFEQIAAVALHIEAFTKTAITKGPAYVA